MVEHHWRRSQQFFARGRPLHLDAALLTPYNHLLNLAYGQCRLHACSGSTQYSSSSPHPALRCAFFTSTNMNFTSVSPPAVDTLRRGRVLSGLRRCLFPRTRLEHHCPDVNDLCNTPKSAKKVPGSAVLLSTPPKNTLIHNQRIAVPVRARHTSNSFNVPTK